MQKISIILPALNEEETIGKVIDEIPKEDMEKKGYQVEIVVVDNGSSDRTKLIVKRKGAVVVTESKRGKACAVKKGFKITDGDFVFILDADYTYPATYIPQMLELLEEKYDVVTGSRLKGKIEKGSMSRFNFIGNHLLALMANILYGTRISDLCTGYWGLKRKVIKNMKIDDAGFELEVNMFTEIAKKLSYWRNTHSL
jgi:dolichol-phosphate mannosyltransferase